MIGLQNQQRHKKNYKITYAFNNNFNNNNKFNNKNKFNNNNKLLKTIIFLGNDNTQNINYKKHTFIKFNSVMQSLPKPKKQFYPLKKPTAETALTLERS